MTKSRIGPFVLEAPLSAQSSGGRVYRAIHLEQRKLAAVRVFTVPMGMTPESRQAFASQIEQLKQLRHPGIVRCYGGGFDTRSAFLAYELIDGESLTHTLARRDRLPWETALEYAQQMAEALQYAHQAGWIHGRLHADKVLITRDSGIKLTDWRRDTIASTIDSGRPNLNVLQFMAPEVLVGGQPDEKSDLYSVGALTYAMLAGSPPFGGDQQHLVELVCNTPAPNVNALVMDCPVWLSVIVEQLLSKDPKHRPFSATALQLAFKEAQRRQSEGFGVLQHATAGFSPLKMNVDRDEAEKVLGIKPKKIKKQDESSFFEKPWVLLIALLSTLAAVVWYLMPLGEDGLRQRAEARLPPASNEWMQWNEARDAYLLPIVARFAEGKHADWAQDQIEWVDARDVERRLKRDARTNRKSEWTDAERQYWQAMEFEEFGDALSAIDRYRALVGLYGKTPEEKNIVYLAREGMVRIRKDGVQPSQLQEFVAKKLDEAKEAYEKARILEARDKWEWIVNLYSGNQELAPQVLEAQQHIEELKNRR